MGYMLHIIAKMILQPAPLAISLVPDHSWASSSDSLESDLKMRRPSSTNFYRTTRTPSATAPWPEPPSPRHIKTFEFFPFLPDAVRKKIWTLALPCPRVIEIQYTNKQHKFRSPIPILLHVNRESRSVALIYYETAAASPLTDLNSALGHHYLTYVNFRIDTFCPVVSFRSFITGEWKIFLKTLPNCDKIQRLGLPKRCFMFPTCACIRLLLEYRSLREVVVLEDPCIDHRPREDGRIEEGWSLSKGERLATLKTFGEGGSEEVLERYVIVYVDKVRGAWREQYHRKLKFVYKRVCWGGHCWDPKNEVIEEKVVVKPKPMRVVVRKAMGIPRRGVAKVMMLVI